MQVDIINIVTMRKEIADTDLLDPALIQALDGLIDLINAKGRLTQYNNGIHLYYEPMGNCIKLNAMADDRRFMLHSYLCLNMGGMYQAITEVDTTVEKFKADSSYPFDGGLYSFDSLTAMTTNNQFIYTVPVINPTLETDQHFCRMAQLYVFRKAYEAIPA